MFRDAISLKKRSLPTETAGGPRKGIHSQLFDSMRRMQVMRHDSNESTVVEVVSTSPYALDSFGAGNADII